VRWECFDCGAAFGRYESSMVLRENILRIWRIWEHDILYVWPKIDYVYSV